MTKRAYAFQNGEVLLSFIIIIIIIIIINEISIPYLI
jgi:Tfp pilus assembly major pilin PilA